MPNQNIPEDLECSSLEGTQKEFVIEHYKRVESFWRHWTPTIWSIPTAAGAINIGAYSFIFDKSKEIDTHIITVGLAVLFLLNVALTAGLWKHRSMQKAFGKHLLDIEIKAGIKVIEVPKFSGSMVYIFVMVIITIISTVLLFLTILSLLGRDIAVMPSIN